jgi:WD40 repeat protein
LWDVASLRELWSASLSNDVATGFGNAISAHNELLCVGEVGGWVRVWDIRTGRLVHSLEAHNTWGPGLLSISADAKTLVTCGDDGIARLWNLVATNQPPVKLLASSHGLLGAALSSDTRRLALLTGEGTVELYDLATYHEISVFPVPGLNPSTSHLAFLPDGNTLALCGQEGIYVWRAPPWDEIEAVEEKTNYSR